MDDDKDITHHIAELVAEEQRLWSTSDLTVEGRKRLDDIQVELEQCYDLLRQRRAKREYGENPEEARTRDTDTVETYDRVDEELADEEDEESEEGM